jgi:hypothetical protein
VDIKAASQRDLGNIGLANFANNKYIWKNWKKIAVIQRAKFGVLQFASFEKNHRVVCRMQTIVFAFIVYYACNFNGKFLLGLTSYKSFFVLMKTMA